MGMFDMQPRRADARTPVPIIFDVIFPRVWPCERVFFIGSNASIQRQLMNLELQLRDLRAALRRSHRALSRFVNQDGDIPRSTRSSTNTTEAGSWTAPQLWDRSQRRYVTHILTHPGTSQLRPSRGIVIHVARKCERREDAQHLSACRSRPWRSISRSTWQTLPGG